MKTYTDRLITRKGRISIHKSDLGDHVTVADTLRFIDAMRACGWHVTYGKSSAFFFVDADGNNDIQADHDFACDWEKCHMQVFNT